MSRIVLLLFALGLLCMPVFAEDTGTGNGTEAVSGTNQSVQPDPLDDAAADTNITINESQVGSLPGDWDYGFKRFFENVDKFFTWDKSESAKKHAKYGLLRAMEAHVLSGKAQKLSAQNKTADADWALGEVEKLSEEQNDELEDAQTDLEAAVEDGSANETEVEQVQNYTRNSIIVLQRVYEKAPEAAKDGLLRALNNSISNYERHVEKMEEKEQKKEQKRNQTATATGNESEDENETESEVESGKGNKTRTEGKNKGNETEVEQETETGEQPGDLNQTQDNDGNETQSGGGTGKGKGGNQNGDEEEED